MHKFFFLCLAGILAIQKIQCEIVPYVKPALVSNDVWAQVQPYLLPEDHPVKPKLDKLFAKRRFTQSAGHLYLGGFLFKARKKFDQILVAKHPDLKGYVLKIYTDEQTTAPDYPMWIRRIKGAIAVQEALDRLGCNAYFKVPKKWIYPLPEIPFSEEPHPKYFILVIENMHVKPALDNEWMWANPFVMTPERMQALYSVLQDVGLKDSVYIDNVPFCSDGKQAFIDTEHHHRWPIRYDKLMGRIPAEYRDYWRSLIK